LLDLEFSVFSVAELFSLSDCVKINL